MVDESCKIEIAIDVAFGRVDDLRNLLRLIDVLGSFFYFLDQEGIIARIFGTSMDVGKDLRSNSKHESTEVFGKNLNTVRFNQLRDVSVLSSSCEKSPTFRICSACASHLALPSFSVMEPRSRKTCVTTIFETDDCPELFELEDGKTERSKFAVTGEARLFGGNEGENVVDRALPPPPGLPPPPPDAVDTDEAEAAAVVAKPNDAKGVVALDLGDASNCAPEGKTPAWGVAKGDGVDDSGVAEDEGWRELVAKGRAEELRTEEKDEAKGDVRVEGLAEELGRAIEAGSAVDGSTLVAKGVRPRRPEG